MTGSKQQISRDAAYFAYLSQRSQLGLLYRKYFLYPRLAIHLVGRVLDVGCGIGDLLRYRPGTIGTDINTETVAFCKRGGLDARLMRPDQLPFEAAEFDRVVLDNVLEHLAVPTPLLSEITRVLRPGGRLVVGVPGHKGYTADPDHKTFYDEPGLIKTLGRSGYRLITLFYTPLRSAILDHAMRQYCIYGVFEPALVPQSEALSTEVNQLACATAHGRAAEVDRL